MAEDNLLNIIKTETSTSIIKRNVKDRLHFLVGSLDNPKTLSRAMRTKATLEVKSMLKEVLSRLQNNRFITLFYTCKLCLGYYEHLCKLGDKVDFGHLWRRNDLMACYTKRMRFQEAEDQAIYLLEQIDELISGPQIAGGDYGGGSNPVLPRPRPHLTSYAMNLQVAVLVLFSAFTILNVWRQEERDYSEIFSLVKECDPWFRIVETDRDLSSEYTRLQKRMAIFLGDCTKSLVEKRKTSELVLTGEFCHETFSCYERASLGYAEMVKFSRGIWNAFFSTLGDEYFSNTSIVEVVLDSMSKQTKKNSDTEANLKQFIKLVIFGVVNYGNMKGDHCNEVAQILYGLARTDFNEVDLSYVGLALEHCAIALIINDFNACKVLLRSNSILNILVELEFHLKSLANIDELKEHPIAAFFCEQFSTLIISNHQNLLCEVEDHTSSIQLPTFEEVFHRYIDDFCIKNTSERNNKTAEYGYIQNVVRAAVSFSILALATKQHTKPMWMIMKLLTEGTPKADVLKSMYQHLYKVFEVLNNSGRPHEAIETLQSCCEIAWTHVLWCCKMLKSNQYSVSSNFVEDHSIDDFVKRASEGSALLLSLVNRYCKKDLNSMVITCVQGWIHAYREFEISSPVAMIEKWVQIQYEVIEGKDHEVQTIYSLVSELQSIEYICGIIILETELDANRNMYHQNSDVSCRMEMAIGNTLSKIRTRDYSLSRSERLVFDGMKLVSCGTKDQTQSIQYITRAIDLMLRQISLENEQTVIHEKVYPLLFRAYCKRALCNRIAFPKLKGFIEDIKKALNIWSKQKNLHALTLSDNDVIDFFYIADLLSLEGYTKLYADMIRCIVGPDRTSDDLWNLCWQSGNLSHALCVSVLNDEFIEILSRQPSLCDKVTFWKKCVQSEPLKVGVEHTWSLLPTLSVDSQNGFLAKTINEVKYITTTLITSGLASENSFAVSRLHYDLAEKLIAKGLMFEALSYAKKVYKLRLELLSKTFIMAWKGNQTEAIVNGDTFKIRTYVFQTFHMRPSHVSPHGSYGFGTDNCVYVPTPWNIVRCYLESALQIAAIQEMMGNGDKAEKKLAFGKEISSLLNLPLFLVQFSTALGRIYHTKQYWSLALQELCYAEQQLGTMHSCDKCKLISAAKLNMLLGDLYLTGTKNKGKSNDVDMADKYYASAKSNLESAEWKNDVSVPKKESVTKMVFCKASGIPSDMTAAYASETACWHCQPSVIEKSLLLRDHIDMKWECTRRSHFLELLSKIGKCARLKGDNENEDKQLLSGISMLFLRTTFHEVVLSSSLLEDLVNNNVVADAFGIENASILYKICRFSLKRLFNEDARTILSRTAIVSGLKLAFILSREVPPLHQKVSRLLAVVYANFSKDNMLSTVDAAPSMTQWAAYFHQGSIGTHVNHYLQETEHINVHGGSDDGHSYALAPCNVMKLEQHVIQFFKMLPTVDILCISLVKDNSDKLFQNLLSDCPTSTWIMLSRLSLNNGVVCVILPIGETLKGYSSSEPGRWLRCDWADQVFDKVAPRLKGILEENTRLKRETPSEQETLDDLDSALHKFLREVEESWLGPWKQLLLGQWSDCIGLDDIIKRLKDDLEQGEHMMDVDEKYLKLVIEGAGHDYQEEPMAQLLITKGCFIGKLGCHTENDRLRLDFISKKLKNAFGKMQLKNDQCREPVIIVPDLNVQMLPFESLPVLQKKEVYRMPSVAFIFHKTNSNGDSTELPTMNPSNCYYLINPSCDLHLEQIQENFERWSRILGFTGDANTVPPLDKLREALEKCELFVYAGHSSGKKYISGEKIRKIKGCASVLLMGCSSGYISSSKTCIPKGAPLDYLLASSSVVVSYLWTVYTLDLQRLLSALFRSWVKAKAARLIPCAECTTRDADAQATQTSRKRKFFDVTTSELDTSTSLCKHEFNLGSFIPKAREACWSKYLHGAALVIYGLPTCIDKKTCN